MNIKRFSKSIALTAVVLGMALLPTISASAWSSSVGSAPADCQDDYFAGSSYYPNSTTSIASTADAGNCLFNYTFSAALRWKTGGTTTPVSCTTSKCNSVETIRYTSYTYFYGGRHVLGSTAFNS